MSQKVERILKLIAEAELDPAEREELLSALQLQEMSLHPFNARSSEESQVAEFPLIVKTPNVCGGTARLIRTRIPVWTLERMRQLGFSNDDILRSYPNLRAADLLEAWEYADRHRDEIEQLIRENEEE